MDVRFIRSPGGEEMVLISRADYDALVAAARDEEEDDIALYDARKAELAASRIAPLPEAVSKSLLRGDTRLRALRIWRGLNQQDLARKAMISQGYLSELESRSKECGHKTLDRLAAALDVPVEWIA